MREITWTDRALNDMDNLDRGVRERVFDALDYYAITGQGDVRRLQGIPAEWRLRVGDWRVRFSEQPDGILILRVLPRGRAYRR